MTFRPTPNISKHRGQCPPVKSAFTHGTIKDLPQEQIQNLPVGRYPISQLILYGVPAGWQILNLFMWQILYCPMCEHVIKHHAPRQHDQLHIWAKLGGILTLVTCISNSPTPSNINNISLNLCTYIHNHSNLLLSVPYTSPWFYFSFIHRMRRDMWFSAGTGGLSTVKISLHL